MKMIKYTISIIGLIICFIVVLRIGTYANSLTHLLKNPNITLSPDGEAFTMDYLVKGTDSILEGYTIELERESTLSALNIGEHYYEAVKEGDATVGKWVVGWHTGQCIHKEKGEENYHGLHNNNTICGSYYFPGWFAYCADCGELISNSYFYMQKSTAQDITAIPASGTYFYSCPWCLELEQGISYTHKCKEISANRYQISYDANSPINSTVEGSMRNTLHMYNNDSNYEGQSVETTNYRDKTLRENVYVCKGFDFIAWNTEPDGSGKSFQDGQEILNLTSIEGEIVTLYAQWKSSYATLRINPAGGTYQGHGTIFSTKQEYRTSYSINTEAIQPPNGYLVKFDSMGGQNLENIITSKAFETWQYTDLKGKLLGNTYYFVAPDGNEDMLTATYVDLAFVLPTPKKAGNSFVGWYLDEALTIEYAKGAEFKTTTRDITLYAKWAPLFLEAKENYTLQGGVGAVDLSWSQADDKEKLYKIYQSVGANKWNLIVEKSPIQNVTTTSQSYTFESSNKQYKIASSGYYKINLCAAQGGDYASKSGGLGGSITTTVWLESGSIVEFEIGIKPNNNAGGGATAAYLISGSSRILIAGAGGGGGANALYVGGSGGVPHLEGEYRDNAGGGGGLGFPSGSSGKYIQGTVEMIPVQEPSLSLYGKFVAMAFGDVGYPAYTYLSYGSKNINNKNYIMVKKTSGEIIYLYYNNYTAFADLTTTNVGTADFSNGVLTYYYTAHDGHTTKGYHSMKGTICNGFLTFFYKHEIPGSYLASEGGSNYISSNLVTKASSSLIGKNKGDGYASITCIDAGFVENNELDGVYAPDKMPPGTISDYWFEESQDQKLLIYWQQPKDYGITYDHKVESYQNVKGSLLNMLDSNITQTTIQTGVKGYYYLVNDQAITQVNSLNYFTVNENMKIDFSNVQKYLHIASIDRAGNLSETTHIALPLINSEDVLEYFNPGELYTKQLEIISNTGGIFRRSDSIYYVRADDKTEYELVLKGYVEGEVRKDYQIEEVTYSIQNDVNYSSLHVPVSQNMDIIEIKYDNAQINRYENLLGLEGVETTYASATRSNYMSYITAKSGVKFHAQLDGEVIEVYPTVRAQYEGVEYISSAVEDMKHGITIYPDAIPPDIIGVEILENIEIMELTEKDINVEILATDTGSGLKELAIHIKNNDNGLEETYVSTSGAINININKESALFLGDIEITFIAIDQVGNVTTNGGDGFAFSLSTALERVRNPENTNFKEGDGVVLKIETRGYVERVEITFPEVFVKKIPDLNHTYNYEFPYLIKEEKYTFNIPLGVPNGEYEVLINAYKGGKVLYSKEQLFVVQGTVLDELRTRVRDY